MSLEEKLDKLMQLAEKMEELTKKVDSLMEEKKAPKHHVIQQPVAGRPIQQKQAPEQNTGRRPRGKRPAITQQLDMGERPNRFEESKALFNAHKEDVKIDKLLTKHREGNPRTVEIRSSSSVELVCSVCGYVYDVHESLIPPEADRYVCDDCVRSK